VKAGEELYAAWLGDRARDPDRMRRFGRGIELFRREQPERFEKLRREVLMFQRRLELVRARPKDLGLDYHRVNVWRFVWRNLAAMLLGFPLFALGVAIYALPFYVPRWLNRVLRQPLDRQGTVKFFSAVVLAPIWLALLGYGGFRLAGRPGMALCLAGALPLALFTRYFLEQRKVALRDLRVFLALHSRGRLRLLLGAEGDRIATEIDVAAGEYRPRVMEPLRSSHG
jgi:glycerol-3-phosphate O-acyltransferase / dihydroxyacetone phosphate acyltransferase